MGLNIEPLLNGNFLRCLCNTSAYYFDSTWQNETLYKECIFFNQKMLRISSFFIIFQFKTVCTLSNKVHLQFWQCFLYLIIQICLNCPRPTHKYHGKAIMHTQSFTYKLKKVSVRWAIWPFNVCLKIRVTILLVCLEAF